MAKVMTGGSVWNSGGILLGPSAVIFPDGSILVKRPNGELEPRQELFPETYNFFKKLLDDGVQPHIM